MRSRCGSKAVSRLASGSIAQWVGFTFKQTQSHHLFLSASRLVLTWVYTQKVKYTLGKSKAVAESQEVGGFCHWSDPQQRCISFFSCHTTQFAGSQCPNFGLNPGHGRKLQVLTTRPGGSQQGCILTPHR